jgi:manganese/zinc/iron transport system substrate-binding protein
VQKNSRKKHPVSTASNVAKGTLFTVMKLWAVAVLSLLLLLGCASQPQRVESDGAELYIVTTTGMLADLARSVGGERVRVDALMGPGTDPHIYQASPGDISKLNRADLVLYNGLHLEGRMGEMLERLGRKKPVLALAETLPNSELIHDGAPDPHVWFDVILWAQLVDPLVDQLVAQDPEGESEYRNRATDVKRRLEELDRMIREELAKIPDQRRILITAHDAFRYFGRAYGIEVVGIQGISTESEASLREINHLVDLIVTRQVPAIFIETSVSEKNVQALLEGARRRGWDARVGGELFSDAMGAAGTPEGTYEGMLLHNVRQIVDALAETNR